MYPPRYAPLPRIRFLFGALAGALALAALLDCSLLVPTGGLTAGDSVDTGATGAPLDPVASAAPSTAQPEGGDRTPGGDDNGDGDGGNDAPLTPGADSAISAVESDAETTPALDGATDAPPDAACDVGLIACDGACVDPTRDPLNCNGCGNVCNSGLCGTSIAATMQTTPSDWVMNGTTRHSAAGGSVAMTAPNVLYQAGTVSYRHPIAVDTFVATFSFRMGQGGGSRNDGMGFMLQTTGPSALGGNGEALAMTGLGGYGVELDIVDNGACGDVSGNHVGVDSLANCPASNGQPTSLFSDDLSGVVDLADAKWHQAVVELAGGALTVQIDGSAYANDVTLPGFTPGTPYYFGFAGATGGLAGGPDGGGGDQTEVKEVSVTFPTARCL
jgi:hypothetical protein